jgi:hypothetical protein
MTNRPVHEIRMGRVRAAVWRREADGRTRHHVSFSRLYKDAEGRWKDSASFNPADLPLLIKVADQAYTWIHQGAGDAADASGLDETDPAAADTPPGGDDAA